VVTWAAHPLVVGVDNSEPRKLMFLTFNGIEILNLRMPFGVPKYLVPEKIWSTLAHE